MKAGDKLAQICSKTSKPRNRCDNRSRQDRNNLLEAQVYDESQDIIGPHTIAHPNWKSPFERPTTHIHTSWTAFYTLVPIKDHRILCKAPNQNSRGGLLCTPYFIPLASRVNQKLHITICSIYSYALLKMGSSSREYHFCEASTQKCHSIHAASFRSCSPWPQTPTRHSTMYKYHHYSSRSWLALDDFTLIHAPSEVSGLLWISASLISIKAKTTIVILAFIQFLKKCSSSFMLFMTRRPLVTISSHYGQLILRTSRNTILNCSFSFFAHTRSGVSLECSLLTRTTLFYPSSKDIEPCLQAPRKHYVIPSLI